jgi:hypothetical protein
MTIDNENPCGYTKDIKSKTLQRWIETGLFQNNLMKDIYLLLVVVDLKQKFVHVQHVKFPKKQLKELIDKHNQIKQ